MINKTDLTDAQNPHSAFRFRPLLSNEKIYFPNNLYLSIHGSMRDTSYFYNLSNLVLNRFKKENKIYNSLISFGNLKGQYHKEKLVPFGEYVPYSFFNYFCKYLTVFCLIPYSYLAFLNIFISLQVYIYLVFFFPN